jgi:oligopeptide transport system ATP-binding protein
MNPATSLLEVRGLRVDYQSDAGMALRAVDEVGFEVMAGESFGLVGESGSGKSSIARALLSLVPATGSVRFLGHELLSLPEPELRALRPQLQMVFQDPLAALDPRMTVADLVAEPLRLPRPGADDRRAPATVAAMLERVGLGAGTLGLYPRQLSGGQAQRVAIARALVAAPRLLVCDEPLSSLDVSVKSQVANLLADLRQQLGLSLLIVAHELPLVRFLCERVAVLFRGRIVETGTREAVFGTPRHPYTRQLLASHGQGPTPALAALPSASDAPPGGCAFRLRCPAATGACAAAEPALSEFRGSKVACHRVAEL